jgi:hypothetical protein
MLALIERRPMLKKKLPRGSPKGCPVVMKAQISLVRVLLHSTFLHAPPRKSGKTLFHVDANWLLRGRAFLCCTYGSPTFKEYMF